LPLRPTPFWWLGAALGVVGIPVYAVGIERPRGSSPNTRAERARSSRVAPCSAGTGAVIHGLTALLIAGALRANALGAPPLEEVAASGPFPIGLWGLAGLGPLVASLAFALPPVTRSRSPTPRSSPSG
jgi:drug/metabolite transporter (DMT)-like permease